MDKKAINLSLETVVIFIIILVVIILVIYFIVTYIPNLFDVFRQQGSNAASLAKSGMAKP